MVEYLPWSNLVLDTCLQDYINGYFSVLDIELGGACNYHCIYCDSPQRDIQCTVEVEGVKTILQTGKIKWVYICGLGEPTVGENLTLLLQILQACKANQVKCSIFTNLANIDDRILEFIKDGVLHLMFKYDSQDSEACGHIYNDPNITDQLKNVQRIKEFVNVVDGRTNIAASIVPTQKNKNQIPAVVKDCIDSNIYPLIAELEQSGKALECYDKLSLSQAELDELKAEIEAILGEKYSVPVCPAVICGIHVRHDGVVTVDKHTGLSCPWFWLREPDTKKVCTFNNTDYNEIVNQILSVRTSMRKEVIEIIGKPNENVFGGCGGDISELIKLYLNLTPNNTIYLDNNATTQLYDSIKRVYIYSLNQFFNPSAIYAQSRVVEKEIDEARKNVATLINAAPKNIVFNSGATEGNNTVLNSILSIQDGKQKHIIISCVEHSAILETAKYYEEKFNVLVTRLPVDKYGRIEKASLIAALRPDTVLVSIMLANNEIGNIYPIKEFAAAVHNFNPSIVFHTDATQAIGKMNVDVEDLGVDYLTLSGHKFHAPKGIGALYSRSIENLVPFIHGGHQETGKRAGTENTNSIIALGEASRLASMLSEADYARIASLRDNFENRITSVVKGAVILGDVEHRICNTSCILVPGTDGRAICDFVNAEANICISTGAACDSKDLGLSHVMRSLGVEWHPIRVSLSRKTTMDEIKRLASSIGKYNKRFIQPQKSPKTTCKGGKK